MRLTVQAPPFAFDDEIDVPFNTPTAVVLDAGDPGNNPLTYSIVTPPTHGTLSGTAPNLTYTPTTGFSGTDQFTYSVSNGLATSEVATVTLTVSTSAPVANDDCMWRCSTPRSAYPAATGALANDNGNGLALTATLVNPPTNGTLSLNPDGSFTYTPNAGFTGIDSFDYQATDSNGAVSALANVLLLVEWAAGGFEPDVIGRARLQRRCGAGRQ